MSQISLLTDFPLQSDVFVDACNQQQMAQC
jgi:hypothetical protein